MTSECVEERRSVDLLPSRPDLNQDNTQRDQDRLLTHLPRNPNHCYALYVGRETFLTLLLLFGIFRFRKTTLEMSTAVVYS